MTKHIFTLIQITCLSFCFTFGISINAQQIKLSEDTKISILTCDTGTELHTLFGHTAIRINDPANGFDAVYNFGYFDFNTPNFYWKFVKGDLQYFVAVDSFENFITEYIYTKRGVYEQELNLKISEKQKIFEQLSQILTSDRRFYTYKFIDKNCTTMVADLISNETAKAFSTDIIDKHKTNRTILNNYLYNNYFENLGINIIFGHKVDTAFYKVFLPLQLLESLKISKTANNLKVSKSFKLLVPQSKEKSHSVWNSIYTLIFALSIIIILNKKWLTIGYFTINAVVGFFLIGVGFYSYHDEVTMNYNVLLLNPIYLVAAICIANKNQHFSQKTIITLGISLCIYTFYIFDKSFISIVYPLIIANAVLLIREYKKTQSFTKLQNT